MEPSAEARSSAPEADAAPAAAAPSASSKPAASDPNLLNASLTEWQAARAQREDTRRMIRAASRFSYIGIEFVVAPTVGFFIGRWLDGVLGTAPVMNIVWTLLGIATAVWDLIRLSIRARRELERDNVIYDDPTPKRADHDAPRDA